MLVSVVLFVAVWVVGLGLTAVVCAWRAAVWTVAGVLARGTFGGSSDRRPGDWRTVVRLATCSRPHRWAGEGEVPDDDKDDRVRGVRRGGAVWPPVLPRLRRAPGRRPGASSTGRRVHATPRYPRRRSRGVGRDRRPGDRGARERARPAVVARGARRGGTRVRRSPRGASPSDHPWRKAAVRPWTPVYLIDPNRSGRRAWPRAVSDALAAVPRPGADGPIRRECRWVSARNERRATVVRPDQSP